MLAMDCGCGFHMVATDEEQLFGQAREHVDRDHPEMVLTDEELRGILVEGGLYEVGSPNSIGINDSLQQVALLLTHAHRCDT
jgi:predicted small metal-binding protein